MSESADATNWTPTEARRFVADNDDFGFEMRMAAAVRQELGVPVAHGETYMDAIKGKPRQFDFRFRVEENRATLYFAVECKNVSLRSPVVICGRQAEAEETFHEVIVSLSRNGHERSRRPRLVVFRPDDSDDETAEPAKIPKTHQTKSAPDVTALAREVRRAMKLLQSGKAVAAYHWKGRSRAGAE